jgi:Spore coat assembly protein
MKRIILIMLIACLAALIGICVVYSVGENPSVEPEVVETEPEVILLDPEELVVSDDFEGKALDIPIISIVTDDGERIWSKDEYSPSSVSITNAARKHTFDDLSAGVRGRGNATWGMEKKSYRVRFDTKINLFGAGKGAAKSWVLFANHCDQSLLRNYLGLRLGNLFDGIDVSSSTTVVELYLNGKYEGVYLLAEQTQIHQSRVNVKITQTSPETDGYLIELDQYAEGREGIDRIRVNGEPYSIKNEVRTEELAKRIEKRLSAIEDALEREDEEAFCALVDIDSCVDTYLIQEFAKNIDVGWSSFYMYVPSEGEKLFFGCPWDFDLAFGNDERLDGGAFEDLYVATGRRGFTQSHYWFIRLMAQDWFVERVRARWDYAANIFSLAIQEIEDVYQSSKLAFDHNFERWQIFGSRLNQEPRQIRKLNSAREHITYMTSWMTDRLNWLDDYFG